MHVEMSSWQILLPHPASFNAPRSVFHLQIWRLRPSKVKGLGAVGPGPEPALAELQARVPSNSQMLQAQSVGGYGALHPHPRPTYPASSQASWEPPLVQNHGVGEIGPHHRLSLQLPSSPHRCAATWEACIIQAHGIFRLSAEE